MSEILTQDSSILVHKNWVEDGVTKVRGYRVPARTIANTLENIEAIKEGAQNAIKAHRKAKRAEGVLWKDIDDVDAILWVLGITGDKEEFPHE